MTGLATLSIATFKRGKKFILLQKTKRFAYLVATTQFQRFLLEFY